MGNHADLGGTILLDGYFRIESYDGEPEWEFRKAGGGTLVIPFVTAPEVTRLYRDLGQPLEFVRMRGRKLDEARYPNLILNEGLQLVAKFLATESVTGIGKMEISDGNGTTVEPDEDDTIIAGSTNRARVTVNTPSRSGAEITISAPFTAGQSNYVVRDIGLYGNSTSSTFGVGDMLDHSSTSFDNTSPNTALLISGVISIQRKGEI